MYLNSILSPPLGTTTVQSRVKKTIDFVALLETPKDTRYDGTGWVVQLWYQESEGTWQSADFSITDILNSPILSVTTAPNIIRRIYSLHLPCQNSTPVQFTLRFKPVLEDHTPWIWSNEQNGLGDGRVIFRGPSAGLPTFETLFHSSDPNLRVKFVRSQVPGVELFDVTAPIPPIANESGTATIGTPVDLELYYALVKLSSPWMGPRQGSSHLSIDRDGLLMGFLRSDGRHVVVLGVSGINDCTTYVRSDEGKILLKTRNDADNTQYHRAIIAAGWKYQEAVNAAFYRAREIIRSLSPLSSAAEEPAPTPSWYETWYDGLAYCTWNGLGRELTEERILSALQDLTDNGIYVTTLIIDDNWQSLRDNSRWDRFEANSNFPRGLGHTTSEIRRRFQNIRHIAVWHSLLGYWDGIASGGWIDTNYKCINVKWRNGKDVCVVDASDIGRMYNDFYSFLSNNGIDSIKCDAQYGIDDFDDPIVRRSLAPAYQEAFKTNSLKYFSRRAIYCMAHIPYIFFRALLPHDATRALFRNSDDFFPDVPSSHVWHIFANSMNNIYSSNLNCLPDWDMFQSALPTYAGLHAAARCISGGPIYITDSPGQHDLSLIKQIGAYSPEGYTVALRPSCIALPTDPFVAFNSNRFLKVGNFSGGRGGSSILAVFNVSESQNSELILMDDFPGLLSSHNYVIRAHTSGEVTAVKAGTGSLFPMILPQDAYELFTAVPVVEIAHPKSTAKFTFGVLGLISAMSGVSAIINQSVHVETAHIAVTVTLKALGTLGFYISDLASRDITKFLVTIAGNVVPFHTVRKSPQSNTVLEIDLETAWKELNLSTGWSNETAIGFHMK
ncbi:glycoside hydrolase [Choiromyces venosus 120613-1]|uniref:Glycoside hydrolase n=1 Tax=Choiromyces venosus 120613-1 TaxID=1336337 RepID=A0A3N4JJH1_9PEZI|nr:glycoside hydrolase [Choiromyces venosus 120613-1]